MTKYFQTSHGINIAFDFVKKTPHSPVMVYHPGLFVPRNDLLVDEFRILARKHRIGFLTFDNVGHGQSQGRAVDFGLSGMSKIAEEVINGVVDERRPLIMVGHSFGSLVLFNVASRFQRPVSGFIGLNPVWHRHEGLRDFIMRSADNDQIREDFKNGAEIDIRWPTSIRRAVMSKQFVEDVRKTEIENDAVQLRCPAVLFRGTEDPWFTQKQASTMKMHFNPVAGIISHGEGHKTLKRENLDTIVTGSDLFLTAISALPAPYRT